LNRPPIVFFEAAMLDAASDSLSYHNDLLSSGSGDRNERAAFSATGTTEAETSESQGPHDLNLIKTQSRPDSGSLLGATAVFDPSQANHSTLQYLQEHHGTRPGSSESWRADFCTLRRARDLILSPSTFGWWAAVLGDDPTPDDLISFSVRDNGSGGSDGGDSSDCSESITSSSGCGSYSSNDETRRDQHHRSKTVEERGPHNAARFESDSPQLRRRTRRIVRFPVLPLASPLPWCDLIPVWGASEITGGAVAPGSAEQHGDIWVFYDVAKILGLGNGADRSSDGNAAVTSETVTRGEHARGRSYFFTDAETARRACYAYAARGNRKDNNGVARSLVNDWVASTAAAYTIPSPTSEGRTIISALHESTETTDRTRPYERAPIPPVASTSSSPLSISSLLSALISSIASAILWVVSK